MKINRLAVFDIDGTLTDSVMQHQAAFMKALESFGFKDFNTDFGSYAHHTDSFIFTTIFEEQTDCSVQEPDMALFENRLLHFITTSVTDTPFKEIEGAKRYIDFLRNDQGIDVVFATGSLLKPAKLKLQQAGIFIEEELLISANNILSRDEIVSTAIHTAKRFYGKKNYRHIVSFGDGRWDMETARRLNIHFVGIANKQLQALHIAHYHPHYNNLKLASIMNNTYDFPLHFNFTIHSSREISKAFKDKGIVDLMQAAVYVKQLPYKRNEDKYNLATVLIDGHGTCSTKHALLKQLAVENDIEGVQLILCIFKMNATNTPKIAQTLKDNQLDFVLEAHNYLLVNGEVLDCTNALSGKSDFMNDTIDAIEIEPWQINEYKVNFHKKALQNWLTENPQVQYTLSELFAIREQCIADLSFRR
jgi:phosphoglycolate phosphatase-like HAD superfamily hydrolase